jgi:hypothetical protein
MAQWLASDRQHATPTRIATAAAVLTVIGAVSACGDNKKPSGQRPPPTRLTTAPAATSLAPTSTAPAGTPSTAPPHATTPVTAAPADRRQPGSRTAVSVLATLAVKGRAPMTGYSRARFGTAWTDDNNNPLGHNGCDTRNDIYLDYRGWAVAQVTPRSSWRLR